MRRQIKIITIALFFFWGMAGVYAQHKHEISVTGGGGLSSLNYKVSVGEHESGLGENFGLGYHYFFSSEWGIGTGAELAFYNSKYKLDNYNFSSIAIDNESANFEFRSAISGYDEKQCAMMLQIPLMLQFQTDKADRNRQFFAAVGAKAGIPLQGKYRTTVGSVKNAGWYEYEQSLYDTQEFMGFGKFPNRKTNGSLDFKTAFFLSAETGCKWRLHEKWSLYAGLYVDYGLNNVVKKQNVASLPSFVAYNHTNPPEYAVNSIFNSQHTRNGGAPQAFTEKMRPIAAGIKLRLTFGKSGKQTQSEPITQAQPEPQAKPAPPATNQKEAQRIADEAAKCKAAEEEAARRAAEEAARKAAAEALNETIRIIQIPVNNYVLNQTEPDEYQKQRLDEKIALLKKYPNLKFHIQGHTCDIGTNKENERVGSGRDVKARDYIISKGIDERRIISNENKLDTQPVVPNSSEENRRLNRRVQIVVDSY